MHIWFQTRVFHNMAVSTKSGVILSLISNKLRCNIKVHYVHRNANFVPTYVCLFNVGTCLCSSEHGIKLCLFTNYDSITLRYAGFVCTKQLQVPNYYVLRTDLYGYRRFECYNNILLRYLTWGLNLNIQKSLLIIVEIIIYNIGTNID